MKEKVLPLIKKYPMSILLTIIALNLFSIAGSLRETSRMDRITNLCAKYLAYARADSYDLRYKYQKKAMATVGGFTKQSELTAYCYAIKDPKP